MRSDFLYHRSIMFFMHLQESLPSSLAQKEYVNEKAKGSHHPSPGDDRKPEQSQGCPWRDRVLDFCCAIWCCWASTHLPPTPADPGELSVGINHGQSCTTLASSQSVLIIACRSHKLAKAKGPSPNVRGCGVGPGHSGNALLG